MFKYIFGAVSRIVQLSSDNKIREIYKLTTVYRWWRHFSAKNFESASEKRRFIVLWTFSKTLSWYFWTTVYRSKSKVTLSEWYYKAEQEHKTFGAVITEHQWSFWSIDHRTEFPWWAFKFFSSRISYANHKEIELPTRGYRRWARKFQQLTTDYRTMLVFLTLLV